jgi:tetratricopeptide (TPR) repeat protein
MQELPADALLERAGATDAIGYAKTLLGDVQGAIVLREQAIAMLREKFPQGHPLIVTMSVNLAQAYEQARRTDEAIALLDRVLPEQIRLLGENNSDVLWTLTTLAAIERRHERNAAALDYARRAWQIAQTLGDDNDWKAYAYEKYGAALSATGDPRAAIPVLEQALRIDRALLPADHHQISAVEGELALAESLIEGKPSGLAKAQTAYERTAAKYGATSQFATAAQDRVERIRAVGAPRGTP